MKILHVWNLAGVSSILAKYQEKLGHNAQVIKRVGYDRFKIEEFYKTQEVNCSRLKFYRLVGRMSKNCDVIHIHSLIKALCFVDRSKVRVMHFHGTDLREMSFWDKVILKVFKPDRILVSTPDLLCLMPDAECLLNPVDTEHFTENRERKKGDYRFPVPYSQMPNFLGQLEPPIYQERKQWFLSKTAFEALACGLSVKWYGLNIEPPLSERNNPVNVARRTIEIYSECLKRVYGI